MATDQSRDLENFLETEKARKYYNKVLAVCGALAMFEAMDVYVLGVIIASASAALEVKLADFVVIFTFQAAGQILGTYLVAPLADRFGRRPLILWCTVIFGLLTLTCTFSTTMTQFIAQRSIAFIFIGGAVPNIFAMASEISSGKSRHRNLLIMGASHGIGAGLAALAGGWLLVYGWQMPLIACAILTLASAVLGWFYMPESIRFLANNQSKGAQLRLLVGTIDASYDGTITALNETEGPADGRKMARLQSLFRAGMWRPTLMLWVVGAISLSMLGALAQLSPTFFHIYGGVDESYAAYMSSLNGPAGVIWPFALIWIMNRIGVVRAMSLNYAFAACAVSTLVLVPAYPHLGWVVSIGFGAFLGGAVSGFYALCTMSYPTEFRATGTSFAVGAGRVASLGVPLIGGLAIASQVGAQWIALGAAVPLVLVSLVVLGLGSALGRERA